MPLNQPQPDSDHFGYKPTDLDNLSDEEILNLINGTGKVKVAPQVRPPVKKEVDIEKFFNV